ncbi:MAG TPA: hypothetical protein VIG32_01995 [Candidatus Baltobacteraceae bacterium]
MGAIASGLASASVSGQVDVGVLKAVQNLDQTLVNQLFGSIGLGQGVNALA